MARWKAENQDHLKAYREENREYRAANLKRWKQENRERVAEYEHRRRMQKRGGGQLVAYNRRLIFERDNWTCQICMEPVVEDPTIDHIVPLCKGGLDAPWNVQLAHRSCNCSKGRWS